MTASSTNKFLSVFEEYFSEDDCLLKENVKSDSIDTIEGLFNMEDENIWKYNETKQFELNLDNIHERRFQEVFFLESDEWERLKRCVVADVQCKLLKESLNQMNAFFNTIEEGYEHLKKDLYYTFDELQSLIENWASRLKIENKKSIIDKLSEHSKLKVPKIMLPFYLYIYINEKSDNRIIDLEKYMNGTRIVGLYSLTQYPSKISKEKCFKSFQGFEQFQSILFQLDNKLNIKNKSLNLEVFNSNNHLLDINRMVFNVISNDKKIKFKMQKYELYSDDKTYKNEEKYFERRLFENLCDMYLDMPLGIKNYFIRKYTKLSLNNKIQGDSLDILKQLCVKMLDTLSDSLKEFILKTFEKDFAFEVPSKIEKACLIYHELMDKEFYDDIIREYSDDLTPDNIEELNYEIISANEINTLLMKIEEKEIASEEIKKVEEKIKVIEYSNCYYLACQAAYEHYRKNKESK